MTRLRMVDRPEFTIMVEDDSPLVEHHQFEVVPSGLTGLTVEDCKELTGGTDLTGFQMQEDKTYNADDSAMARIEEYQARKEG